MLDLFGTSDHTSVEAINDMERRRELSALPAIRDAAAGFEDVTESDEKVVNLVKRVKPKYCQCWFMELDDSPFTQWVMRTAKQLAESESSTVAPIIDPSRDFTVYM